MRVFIFNYVDDLTSSYHSGGGLVVVTDTIERVNEMFPQTIGVEPDDILETTETVEKSFVFPDAGCC